MSIYKIRQRLRRLNEAFLRSQRRLFSRYSLFFLMMPCLSLLMGAASSRPVADQQGKKAVVITVVGSINAATADYIEEGIRKAVRGGAAILILEMDTPGGFLQATRSIVKSILNAEIPVAVLVTPSGARAGSAGVFITLAGHIAAMSPGTNIGAAHPVTGGGKDPEESGGKHMARKIENDTVAFVTAIANQRKRNVAWAKKAVLDSDSITSDEALKLNVIDLIVPNVQILLQQIDGKVVRVQQRDVRLKTKTLPIERLEMTFKQSVVNFFADPNIAYFLLTFGMLGIVMEIYHPGAIFPGVFGAICLFLSFVAMQVLPINYGGLALMGLGVLLLVAEMLTPTFGVLFLGGVISLTVGSIFLIDSPDPNFRISLSVIMPTVLTMAAFLGLILLSILRTYQRKPPEGLGTHVGSLAISHTALQPDGKVMLEGELWSASAEESIPKGVPVLIVAMDGLTLKVKPAHREEKVNRVLSISSHKEV